jgi:lipoate-protein ligase A
MTAREILVYFDAERDPHSNLGRESELFEAVDRCALPEALRFWINSRCLVRGRARTARYGWYREDRVREVNIPVVERSTGGGVVYNDVGNLNWSFFFKTSGAFVSPTTAFGQASAYIISALNNLGVKASFAPPNRIDVSGRKISGMAAKSTAKTLLVHGTLLLNSNLEELNFLCVPPPGCPPVSNVNEFAKNIDSDRVTPEVLAVLRESGFQVRTEDGKQRGSD